MGGAAFVSGELLCPHLSAGLAVGSVLEEIPDGNVIEADTVDGPKDKKVLSALFFRNGNLQLAFLKERNVAASVGKVFEHLRTIITPEDFTKLFPIILADRGSEFTSPLDVK